MQDIRRAKQGYVAFSQLGLLALLLIALAGCSSSWKAPMETRGDDRRSSPQTAQTSASVARASSNSQREARSQASNNTASRTRSHATARARKDEPIPSSASGYRVQRGDTLYTISWRTNRDFRDLAKWNAIEPPYVIYEGQQLRLKPPAPKVTSSRKPAGTRAPVNSQAQLANRQQRQTALASAKADEPLKRTGKLVWSWPIKGPVISSFNGKDPLRKGLKIGGKLGDAVRASESGKVVYSGGGLIGYGRLIIVKHNDKYLSAYGHNRKLLVREGDRVSKGQQIAELGASNNGRPMLHFEIRRDGKPVNPRRLLPR